MKRIVLIHLTLLTLFIIPYGCNKNKLKSVSGKIINTGTSQPVDSVLVVLKDGVNPSSGGFNFELGETSSGKKSYAYTNSNGEFIVEIKGEHQAWLSASKEGYSLYKSNRDNIMGALLSYPDGLNSGIVIELKADAKFKGIFKSTSPVKSTDTLLVYTLFYNNINHYDWKKRFVGHQIAEWSGAYPAIGDKYLRLKLDFQRNNNWHSLIDSVYIKSFETFNDTILY